MAEKEIKQEIAKEETKEQEEKPAKEEKKASKKVSQAEFEKKVLDLAKQGLTSEKIGQQLRDKGIHPQEYKKSISKILKDKDSYTNPDLKNVEEKLERIKSHYEKNKQDKRAMREKDRVFSQVRKLKKYFGVAIK